MNPVTVEMLRADWEDDPNLTEKEAEALAALPDDEIQAALDKALRQHEDMWHFVLDNTRSGATQALQDALEKRTA